MNQRTRLIAGIFALVAMTFSLAEAAGASTCAPSMDMHASDAAAEQVQMHHCLEAGLPDLEREDGREDAGDCPFSQAAAQACAGLTSLPSHAVAGIAPFSASAAAIFADSTQYDLLLRNDLFRPPRA